MALYLLLLSLLLIATKGDPDSCQTDSCETKSSPYISKTPNKTPRTTISNEQSKFYHENGYIFIREMFTNEEMDLLRTTIENDKTISNNTMPMKDSNNKESKLTLWFHLRNDDLYSMFARSSSIYNILHKLIDDEPYHFHSKIMYKEPRIGGAWNYHQDFGYWYNQGVLYPDSALSVMIAIDDHTVENGCLNILAKSHLYGRIDHGIYNDQQIMDPKRFDIMNENCETINVELNRGDVLIWHSNLVHWSEENKSDYWRRALIMGYNGKNAPVYNDFEESIIIGYEKIEQIHDDEIINCGLKGHTKGRTDFLTLEKNIESFKEE
eukprot:483436_1